MSFDFYEVTDGMTPQQIGEALKSASRSNLTSAAYQNRSQSDKVIDPAGAEQQKFRDLPAWQDLARGNTLIDPLTGDTNIELINIGQPLEAIPGATSAPYWTDPGSITLSRTNDDMPAEIPGLIEYVEDGTDQFVRFTNPEGYGDSSNSKRRTQVFFDWVSGRKKVRWNLSFRMGETDDCPYSPLPDEYLWKTLIFQWKGAGEPMFNLSVEAVPGKPDTYNLFFLIKYSSLPGDSETYRRGYNSTAVGNVQGQSGITRYFEKEIKKGEWVDMTLEAFLDERDISATPGFDGTFGGQGYLDVFINNEQVLAYVGPTISRRDTDGSIPNPHAWMIGLYRNEGGLPDPATGVWELNLDSETNPAPYTRCVEFRRAELLDLSK